MRQHQPLTVTKRFAEGLLAFLGAIAIVAVFAFFADAVAEPQPTAEVAREVAIQQFGRQHESAADRR